MLHSYVNLGLLKYKNLVILVFQCAFHAKHMPPCIPGLISSSLTITLVRGCTVTVAAGFEGLRTDAVAGVELAAGVGTILI